MKIFFTMCYDKRHCGTINTPYKCTRFYLLMTQTNVMTRTHNNTTKNEDNFDSSCLFRRMPMSVSVLKVIKNCKILKLISKYLPHKRCSRKRSGDYNNETQAKMANALVPLPEITSIPTHQHPQQPQQPQSRYQWWSTLYNTEIEETTLSREVQIILLNLV